MLEIKVNVQVGVTPEVVSLVSAILNRPAASVEAPAKAAEEPEAAAPAAARRGRPKKNPDPVPAEEPAQEPAPEAAAPAATDEDLPFANEDEAHEAVRAAMDETRKRIEGEDYKENTTSERYVKYHKKLTAAFKSIAKELSGQEKPSALSCEHSAVFVATCKLIREAADGSIETSKE